MSRAWTEQEDIRLVSWGCSFEGGYGFVAVHDLDRTEQEGNERIAHLRATKPDWVAETIRKAGEL